MFLNLNEFEQHFTEQVLKKGLSLFRSNKVEELQRQGQQFRFLVGTETLSLKKRGDSVGAMRCACGKAPECSHSCAVLFWFQKDKLGLKPGKDSRLSVKRKVAPSKGKELGRLLTDAQPDELIAFILQQAGGNPLFMETALAHFSGAERNRPFDYYRLLVRNLLSAFPYTEGNASQHWSRLETAFRQLMQRTRKNKDNINQPHYLSLAILAELKVIFGPGRDILEPAPAAWITELMTGLGNWFESGPDPAGKTAWLEATRIRLRSSGPMYTPVVFFLLLRAVSLVRNRVELQELKKDTGQKQQRFVGGFGTLDLSGIFREAFHMRELELTHRAGRSANGPKTAEQIVAGTELLFCSGKGEKAFLYFEGNFRKIEGDKASLLKELLDYILEKCRDKKRRDLELYYLEESLVRSPLLQPLQIDRFLALHSGKQATKAVDRLAARIKKQAGRTEAEKTALLFLKTGRTADLIAALESQSNKFNLVHTTAQRLLPEYNKPFLKVYTQQLVTALREARYTNLQQPLFLRAKRYLDALPQRTANDLVKEVLKHLWEFKHLHAFILGHYPHAVD